MVMLYIDIQVIFIFMVIWGRGIKIQQMRFGQDSQRSKELKVIFLRPFGKIQDVAFVTVTSEYVVEN